MMKDLRSSCSWLLLSFLLIPACSCWKSSSNQDSKHQILRYKRQAPPNRKVFVIPRELQNSGGQLFSVAVNQNALPKLTYRLANGTSNITSISIEPNSGIVLRTSGFGQNQTRIDFEVEVLENNIVDLKIPITIHIISRSLDDPIFGNKPQPMWAVCPEWIRPGTVIYTLQALDLKYGATDIVYNLESGGEGKFRVDPSNGEVSIVGRQQFELGKIYTLVVSALSQGMKLPSATVGYSQSLNIKIGTKEPQFYTTPYNVTFFEDATANSIIGMVEALSFQNLPLTISMTPLSDLFTLEGQGSLRLSRQLTWALDLRQYFFNITAKESFTSFTTTTTLVITLLSVNHAPVFPASHHTRSNVSETLPVGTELLTMVVRDYDPGALGALTFETTNEVFKAELNSNGLVTLSLAKQLNYESVVNGLYDFKVLAKDGGTPSMVGTATVQIWVKNENNKAPVFEPSNQSITIREGAGPNLVLFYIQAYDPDGDGITFTLNEANPNEAYFSVDGNTGEVTLKKSIVAGQNISSFKLSITIKDDGSCCTPRGEIHETTGIVVVEIYRVNTQPTFPDCKSYAPTVTEDQVVNDPMTILNMTAVDTDVEQNGELVFQIYGDENTYFQVIQSGPRSAQLQLKSGINRDTRNILKFNDTFKLPVTVSVRDKGIPTLTSYCLLFVTIKTVNKNPPNFDYSNFDSYIYIPDLQVNQRLAKVFAYDLDYGINGQFIYSMSNVSSDLYCSNMALDEQTGWILWKGTVVTPPVQKIICMFLAIDKGRPSQSSLTQVSFFFENDVSYKPPIWRTLNGFQIDDTEVSILENATKDSVVTSLSAYTNSINASIEFFIPTEGIEVFNGKAYFDKSQTSAGNSAGMNVIVKKELPEANLRSEYFLRCRAFFAGFDKPLAPGAVAPANLARLRVKVKDVNNQVPEFLGRDSNGIYVAAVTQYSKNGDYVVTVTAVDMDKDWPNNKVTYSLQDPSEYFSIDGTNGEIKVSSSKSPIFDPDIKSLYELVVVAMDGAPSSIAGPGPNKASTRVQIIVSGATLGNPYFNTNFTASLDEGQPRFTNVTIANATVPKTPSGGTTSIVRYNIQKGNDLRNFAVDPDTGRIYTVRPIFISMAQTYLLTYAVFNGLKNSLAYVTIAINEVYIYPPSFAFNNYFYSGSPITEKDPNSIGTKLATVSASGKRDTIAYMSSDISRFEVNNLGEVTLAKGLSRDSPDGFAPQQVSIVANDGLNPPAYAVLTLNLTDINDHRPLFDTCCTKGYVDENAAAVSIMQLKAWDADYGLNGTVEYSIVDDPFGKFKVSPNGDISIDGPLNFEGRQKYSVTVKASDKGIPKMSSQTTVDIFVRDVSESPPAFLQGLYVASAPEELPVSTSVFSVRATDLDPMDRLVYSISDVGGSNDGKFFYVETLQTFNGSYETSTAQRVATAVIKIAQRIDYDATKQSKYSFQLQVKDSSNLQTQTTIEIQITDINDNPPVFAEPQKNVTLNENIALGASVTTFTAADIDSGVNGKFSYSVDYEQSDPRFMFQVDPTLGQVTVRSQLDYEWKPKMEVKILAIDQGTPPLTGTATLLVTVGNADDSAPTLRSRLPVDPIPVPTNSNKGQQVQCLNVYDPDNVNNNNNFNYQLDCTGLFSERCSDFTISQAGCLMTNRDDYSKLAYDSYIIPVKMTKKTGSPKSTTEVVGLTLKNQAPGPPKAGEKKVSAMNYVGANGGFSAMPLGSVYAVDSDAPEKMSYSIDPPSSIFYLDTAKGQIWLRGNATAGEQVANVKVINNNYPSQTVDSKVKVNLNHVNESVLKAATSLRIIGLRDASDLLQPVGQGIVLDLLSQKIGEVVGGNSVVEILSIWTAVPQYLQNTSQPVVDVLYAVHGSPYYSAEKLSALVWASRSDIFQKTKLNITMSPVDLCKSEFYNCWDQGCETRLEVDESKPRLVNANRNSFVGITAVFRQVCSCPGRTSPASASAPVRCSSSWCFNGGSCVLNNSAISCLCPAGFEGRRCQKTKISIRDGFILLPPLSSCEVDHLSFEFLASMDSPQNALLLYNGPTSDPGPSKGTYEEVTSPTYQSRDFLLLELANGKPKLRIDFGDGEFNLGFESSTLATLNDGKWHSIDVIHTGKEVRLVIDKCGRATLAENISSSVMDTSNCEARGTAPLQRFLLNTVAPLQLGGRWDSNNQYPTDWIRGRFRGCIRNLQHNGETYDLSFGSWRQYNNTQDSCPNDNCNSCPPSATCLPNVILGTAICQCPLGFRGNNCDVRTTTKYFNENGFAQWETTDEFRTALNSSYLQSFWFADRVDLSFRTRRTNGVLFMAQSFTGLERYLLEVKNSTISLASDLGSGDIVLTLPNVNVSDGGWHRIQIIRYGNLVEMHLDLGEGVRYNASLPTDQHRLLRIKSASVLGDVFYNEWRKELIVSKSLGKSCVADVRYGGYWWPLSDAENSEPKVTARVTLMGSSDTGCSVGACSNQCPASMICVDLWQATQCICKNYTIPPPTSPDDQCSAKSCLTSPCQNGATCVLMDNLVTCVCPPGWFGAVCDSRTPISDENMSSRNFNLAAAIVLPIIFGLILLLLLALLIWYCCCRKKRDPLLFDEPDKDIRENVIVYDDEGAGEEDNYAFDLSQLQRSSPLEVESLKKTPDLLGLPAFESRAGAGKPMPGDYPSIADYIADKLNDIDNNPETLLDDSRANFTFEGRGSLAGSLSSLASSEGDRDADFDWLEDVGPRFGRLADLYGEGGQV